MTKRCDWAQSTPLMQNYHDYEWGRPVHNEQKLFEILTLEMFQAGLSWAIVLKKRETIRQAFLNFDFSRMSQLDVDLLMQNSGIIRYRRKIEAVLHNASQMRALQETGGLNQLVWSLVDNQTIDHQIHRIDQVPTSSPVAIQLSNDLKLAGFKFLGPATVCSFMRAAGVVNDHLVDCIVHDQIGGVNNK